MREINDKIKKPALVYIIRFNISVGLSSPSNKAQAGFRKGESLHESRIFAGYGNLGSEVWNLESRIRNLKSGIRNLECGIWSVL